MRRYFVCFATAGFIMGMISGHAGVITDGSLGAAGPLPGPNFAVPANLGRISGRNLFHSFSQFNLTNHESATFSGPSNVQNVLARVTGGSASSIDGLIRSTIADANFFLINPRGVVFGPNASVDVSGSFVVTTGDHVAFTDGSHFNAIPGVADSTLTSAPPVAFGFLSPPQTGTISVSGSQFLGAPRKTWAFAGSKVEFDNAAFLNASAVVIRGGQLTMDNFSQIFVDASTPGDGADIKMETSIGLANGSSLSVTAFSDFANVTVASISAPTISIASFSSIGSVGNADMNAGNLSVMANQLVLADFARIGSDTVRAGTGGDVVIGVRNLTMGAGSLIQATTSGPGMGGTVHVEAANVAITGGTDAGGNPLQTGITADAYGDGAAGDVQLNLTGQLNIVQGAQVSSDTFGAGDGGNVGIVAQGVVVDGAGLPRFTAISTETQNEAALGGQGGNIVLNIQDTLQLIGGGEVTARTFGSGQGGNILVNAAHVYISGEGALFSAGIGAASENPAIGGPSGDIQLNLTGSLEIVAGGSITVTTSGPGAGGNVSITAPLVSISGFSISPFDGSPIRSSISATTLSGLNGGHGGDILITADSLQGSGGGEISASTAGSGTGGSIDIRAHALSLNNFAIRADTTSQDTAEVPVSVSDLNVSFDIDHNNDQNLRLMLRSPDGRVVDLFYGVGGDGQNFHNTVLADNAPISISQGTAPFTGRFRPLNPLAAFNGLPFGNQNSPWLLFLSDVDPFNPSVATLNSWSLRVGSLTFSSSNVPVLLPDPNGFGNVASALFINLPPAAIVPIRPGNGGDVHIHADTLNMLAGASIAAKSTGNGNAGSIMVNANGEITLLGGSSITTSSAGADAGVIDIVSSGAIRLRESNITASAGANGGNIHVTAPGLVYSIDSGITATAGTAQGGGTGGNITVDPQFIVLNNSLISANAAAGQGGNINLISDFFFGSNSLITATGTTSGTINITAPELDLSSALLTLSASLLSAGNQLRESCTAALQGDFSSFISIGRGGTEPAPDELQTTF